MYKLIAIGAGLAVAIGINVALAQPPGKEYQLKVTSAELATIGTALQARPYSEVAQLLAKLQSQIAEQEKPPVQVPGPGEPPKQ